MARMSLKGGNLLAINPKRSLERGDDREEKIKAVVYMLFDGLRSLPPYKPPLFRDIARYAPSIAEE